MSPFSSKPISPMTVLNGPLAFSAVGNSHRVVGAGSLGGVGDDLQGGVGVERVGFRLEAGSAELLDEFLSSRVLARIRREGHQRAVNGVASDRSQFVRNDTVAGHQGEP